MAHIPDFGIVRPPPFLADRPLLRAVRVFNLRHPLEAPPPQPLETEPARRRPRAAPPEFRRTPLRDRARLLDALVERLPAPEVEPIAPEVLQAERAQQLTEQVRMSRNIEQVFSRAASQAFPTLTAVVTPIGRGPATEATQAGAAATATARRPAVRVFELWTRGGASTLPIVEEAVPLDPEGRGRFVDVHA